jgi:hypothetical protein
LSSNAGDFAIRLSESGSMKIRAIIGSRSLMPSIDSAAETVVKGAFKTALEDSGSFGQSIAVHGAYD